MKPERINQDAETIIAMAKKIKALPKVDININDIEELAKTIEGMAGSIVASMQIEGLD